MMFAFTYTPYIYTSHWQHFTVSYVSANGSAAHYVTVVTECAHPPTFVNCSESRIERGAEDVTIASSRSRVPHPAIGSGAEMEPVEIFVTRSDR